MLLPYNVDVPMARLPLANWALIGVTCVITTAAFLHAPPVKELGIIFDPSGQVSPKMVEELRRVRAAAPPLSLQRQHFAGPQLSSYVLVHGDVTHLVGNMVFLFCFGNAVNAKLGHLAFLVLYFTLGVVAGLAWLAVGRGQVLLGASGAVMGITGVFVVLYPRNEVRVLCWWGGTTFFVVASYWVVAICMALDLVGTVFGDDGIAYVSHLAGELVGAAVSLGLLLGGVVGSAAGEENLLQLLGVHEPNERFDFRGKDLRERRR
jgi:membrane associated rhomboid family serine protease